MPRFKSLTLKLVIALGVLVLGTPIVDVLAAKGKIYPGVRMGVTKIGGLTQTEARFVLEREFNIFLERHATVTLGTLQANIPLRGIVAFDLDETLRRAQEVGHTGSLLARLLERFRSRIQGLSLAPQGTIHKDVLRQSLEQAFATAYTPPRDATFTITWAGETARVQINPEQAGYAADIEVAHVTFLQGLTTGLLEPIALTRTPFAPILKSADLEPLQPNVEKLLDGPEPNVKVANKEWPIPRQTLASWIEIAYDPTGARLTFDEKKIIEWLDTIARDVDKKPENAIFELAPDGKKVARFSTSKAGLSLPRAESAAKIAEAVLTSTVPIELALKETLPRMAIAAGAVPYGIKELVGRGTTNFKGSPPNRVKNIKRGAEILNGTLIAPGEEFSLLDHLRPFTVENGYLAELVIKAAEGRTTPEIGGGLCQIGTTMFRTVLNAGLPVTERRNHSYRVSYYEPPVGMDATIYDPAPDFKFLNDTGNWLVLITHTEGTLLTFELWGTKDGRTAVSSEPEVSNIKQPPEKKLIETLDLPPGKIKCTEKAHIGSDARFTYTVTYADGRVEEKEFFSRYRPWQEVCLVGVEALTPLLETPALTSPPQTPISVTDTLPSADALGVIGDTI